MLKKKQKENRRPIIATILFKPHQSTYSRLKIALDYGYELYIFDNSPGINTKLFVEENIKNIRYFTFEKNVGIGPALRLMCSTAYFVGNQNLLYFDQDTIFNNETLNYILGFINESSDIMHFRQREKILSVTFRDAELNRKEDINQQILISDYKVNFVDFTINSGTLFSLENLKKVGWHDESYYIDGVDYSICLSADAKGLKIAEIFDTPGLDHESKQGNKNYKFIFHTYNGRRYPLYRQKDYVYSSLRLIVKSLFINRKKTKMLLRMLLIYVFSQLLFYISKEEK